MMKREIEYNKEESLIASMSSATIIDSYNKGFVDNNDVRKLNSKGQNNKDFNLKAKQLIQLIGPVNTTYKKQALLLLKKHHLNETYARNIFFREIYLNNMNNKHFELYDSVYKKYNKMDNNNNNNNLFDPVVAIISSREEVMNNADLIMRICTYFPGIGDLYNFGCCCKFLSKELLSEETSSTSIVWKRIVYNNFQVAKMKVDKKSKINNINIVNWKQIAKQTIFMFSSFSCPKCNTYKSIIPVVYGYPHKDLIKVMTAKKIILGGDHIFPNSRIWQCINAKCKIAFPVFPYNNIAENLRIDMCNQHKKSAKR